MKFMQLVYCSQPFGYSLEILSAILIASRANNRKHDITGALICRSDIFLQLLEGPEQQVKNIYEKIQKDDRHINVYHLLDQFCEKRLFPAWAMKDDPVKTWMWSREEVSNGIVKSLSKAEVEEVFVKLSKEATIFNFQAMSKYVSYLTYFIAFICFILICLFLILFLTEFYELINRCISVNRFSVSFFNCVQAFYFEILKTSLFIVVLFLLAILIMQKLTVPFRSSD